MYTVVNLVLAFIAGGIYTLCGGAFYLGIIDRPNLSRRWYRLPTPVRLVLLAAWPLTSFWMFL